MQGFRKFEKKFQGHALIKSALFGLSCGIFAVSALWLVLKLRAVTFGVIWYILIGLGVAAATFGLCWLVCRPTEKKVAKKLDKDLRFGEKAQTMVEFQASQEDMARLQRTDADARLAVTPTKAVKTGRLWKNFFCPVIAFAMLLTAILVPMKVIEPTGEEDPPYSFSDFDRTRLEELIENVKASDMESAPKLLIVEDLEGLVKKLELVSYEREMKENVKQVIANTVTLERAVNTYDEISSALNASENEQVQSLGAAIGSVNIETLAEEWNARRDELIGENAVNVQPYEEALRLALNQMTVIRANDPLYEALKAFVNEVQGIYTTTQTTDEGWQKAVDEAFYTVSQASDLALLQQYDNKETADMVVAELMDIFGLTSSDLAGILQSGTTTNPGDSFSDPTDDKESESGGGPNSIVDYGSDDTIYYPDGEKYVKYGEVYSELMNKAYNVADGFSEEMQDLIRAYFNSLQSSEK